MPPTAPDPVAAAKRTLRHELRARRSAMTPAQRRAARDALTHRLDDLVESARARSISCFLSTPTEPDTRAFVAGAVARGVRVLLPLSREGGILDWAEATDASETTAGMFGIHEPTGPTHGPLSAEDVDLMLIPAAAVDRSGHRMGWGRGYYDRALAELAPRPPVYAVVFDDEVLDAVPFDTHDEPVTGVVTPDATLTF